MVRFITPVILILLLFCSEGLAAPRGPRAQHEAVRFVLHAPAAKSVAVTGTFNRWDQDGKALRPDRRGVWSITMLLPPGRYEYAFIVNGTVWVPDPAVPKLDDGFGGKNSVVEVR